MVTSRFPDTDSELEALSRNMSEQDLQPLWELEGLLVGRTHGPAYGIDSSTALTLLSRLVVPLRASLVDLSPQSQPVLLERPV